MDRTPRASIIVPWRPDPDRQRVWDWLKPRYTHQVIEATDDNEGPWVKAVATPYVQSADTDVVAIVDADVWCDLEPAIEHVTNHGGWCVPHLNVHRITREGTEAVLAGNGFDQPLEQEPYEGVVGGGAIVLTRELYLRIPLDPRFRGWGGEDVSWGYALKTLAGTPAWRGQQPLFHLWHPPQAFNSRRHSPLNDGLWTRYLRAHGNPEAMADLVGGVTCSTH